jgi:hypothetical protein
MRLARKVPLVQEKIASGELTLTNANELSSFIKQQGDGRRVKLWPDFFVGQDGLTIKNSAKNLEKTCATNLNLGQTSDSKAEQESKKTSSLLAKNNIDQLVKDICGKTRRECQGLLAAAAGDNRPKTKRPVVKQESLGHVRLSISLDRKTMDRLQKLKLIKQLSLEEIISLASELLEQQEQEKREARFISRPKSKRVKSKAKSKTQSAVQDKIKTQAKTKTKSQSQTGRKAKLQTKTDPTTNSTSPAKVSRYIPKKVRRAAWKEAHGQCLICSSTNFLELDHVKPFALGGDNNHGNIRLLCHNCNQRQAIKSFGVEKIASSY